EQALGWLVTHPEPGREVLMHNGGTGGYRPSLVVEPAKERASVALADSGAEPSKADLATHFLVRSPVASGPPVAEPPVVPERDEVELPVEELDRVVGHYDFGDGVNIIKREGGQLVSIREGVPTLPIYPEAPLSFFFKAINAQLRFTTDEAGN